MKKPRMFLEYYGVMIFRNTEPGSRLRWSARGGFAADTLAGIKAAIRQYRASYFIRRKYYS